VFTFAREFGTVGNKGGEFEALLSELDPELYEQAKKEHGRSKPRVLPLRSSAPHTTGHGHRRLPPRPEMLGYRTGVVGIGHGTSVPGELRAQPIARKCVSGWAPPQQSDIHGARLQMMLPFDDAAGTLRYSFTPGREIAWYRRWDCSRTPTGRYQNSTYWRIHVEKSIPTN
jgi:hypothetical protein